ncbi:hypothetical protein [Flavobacterium sp.]|jgi:hypothetical protein|uniref:hypothetical protein n=1 Tax=Flavobacterium sp. TaxID=239 RepID=UPI0037BF212B
MELLEQQFKNKLHSRTVNVNNEFEVDTEEIIQITKGDQVSYTLPVYRSVENNLVENLVLTLQNNNSFSAKVISYDLTQSEKDLLQNGMFVDVSSKMQVVNLDNGSTIANDIFARGTSGCYDVIIEYEMCCHNIHSTLNVKNGQRCTCPKPPTGYTYTIVSIPCNEDGSGGEAPGDTSPSDYTSPGNDNPYGGSGNGTGGTGSPTNENPDNNESEPISSLGDDLTLPVVKPKTTNPCNELKVNSNNSDFKSKMQTLKDNVNGTKEKAFGVYNGSHVTPTQSNPSCGAVLEGDEQNGSPIPYHISLKATAHNHLKAAIYNHIGTFTPNDLIAFSNLIITAEDYLSPIKKEEFAIYLVCDEGNYALKVSDIDKLYNFVVEYESNATFKDFVDKFYKEKNISHGKPKQDQNIGFLKLLKEYDIGVEYYEADENFENWKKLELDNNNENINETPC